MSRRAALVFTLALACREDAICPNDEPICDCACFEKAEHVEDPGSTDYVATRCEDAEACPFFRLTCDFDLSGGPTSCTAVSDPAALACALDALARRTPGRLRWATESGALGVTDLHIAGDGTAFRVERNEFDLYGTYEDTARYLLEDPAYFGACAAAATVGERAVCLRAPFAGPPEELCIPSFMYSSLYHP